MRASLPTRPVAPLDTDDAFLEAVEGAPEGHLVLVCLHDEVSRMRTALHCIAMNWTGTGHAFYDID